MYMSACNIWDNGQSASGSNFGPSMYQLCEWFKQNPNIIFLHNLKPCEEISITLDDNNIWIFLNHSYMNLLCLGCLIFNLVKSKPN